MSDIQDILRVYFFKFGSGVAVSSVSRGIAVFDLLARKRAMGVRAIAQHLSLPVGSLHRLMLELAEEHVVERNHDGAWQLSYRLLEITDLQLDLVGLPRLSRPFCEAIAEATHETVNVNVLSGDSSVCIDKVRGGEGMQLEWRIGARGPLHCGGGAKSILAFLPAADQVRIANQPKTRFTPHTLVEANELLLEVGRIRQRGYSIDNQEMVLGVFCVGVPIIDRLGRPVGAISISGPTPKTAGEMVQPLVEQLHVACSQVSRRLGYAGPWPPNGTTTPFRAAS